MMREEIVRMLHVIDVNYPNWNFTDEAMSELADVWAVMLAEDDAEAVNAGLWNYIKNDTSGFAPTLGQIRSGIREMVEPNDDTEDMIAVLRKAIGRSGYYYEEEFWKLPDVLKKTVGQATNLRAWSQLGDDELESVVFSHVRRAYRSIRTQEAKLQTMEPIRNEALETVKARLEDMHKPADVPMLEDRKPATRILGERTPYEMQLTDEEREGIIAAWNQKGLMPLSEVLISPARDRKLREIIDRIGIENLIILEEETGARTFGTFLEEIEEVES